MRIENVNLIDIERGDATVRSIEIEDGRVSSVERSRKRGRPRNEGTLDGSGLWAIPGLIDCHVHVTATSVSVRAAESPNYVAAGTSAILRDMLGRGFTTVRDVGGADHGVARAVADGLWLGPRVFFGGRSLSPTGGHGDGRGPGVHVMDQHHCAPTLGHVCDGVPAVLEATRHMLRTGADHVKIMLSGGVASPTDRVDSLQFTDDEIRAVVDEARRANRYVAGHAYPAAAVNRGLRLGVRTIEHGNLIDEESVSLLTSIPDVFLVPTLVTYVALDEEGATAGLGVQSQTKVHDVLDHGLAALKLASEGGVSIAYGTDLLGPMHRRQSEEFAIRGRVQSPLEVLRSATTVAAKLLGRAGDLGNVAPGARADIVLLRQNPLESTDALANPSTSIAVVIKDGEVAIQNNGGS